MLWNAARFALIGLVSMGALCDTFTPRDAPEPCVECVLPVPLQEPLTPEIVRDNIKALIERPTVTPNYSQSLTDASPENGGVDFVYVPDARALSEATPGFFDGWDAEREVRFMQNLLETGETLPKDVDIDFRLYADTGELSGDQARYLVEYEFTLVFPDTTRMPPERRERYCARAIWDLSGGNNNFWRLQRWEDLEPLEIPGDPCDGTMGLLRALSGQEG